MSAIEKLDLPDAEVWLDPNFLSVSESESLFVRLTDEIHWEQTWLKMFGKELPAPRLTAWYGDEGKDYSYSGITHRALPWTEALWSLKRKIESVASCELNSVLLNQYRGGSDSVSWHSDDEKELGRNPVIASVSLGATRRFQLRHKTNKELRYSMDLTSGSLLFMSGPTQHHWHHQVPKTKRKVGPRINLTFRNICTDAS